MLSRQGLIKNRIVSVQKNRGMVQKFYSLTETGENQLEVMLAFLERLRLVAPLRPLDEFQRNIA